MSGRVVELRSAARSPAAKPASPPPAYAELAVTSNFSFLRGASDPEELVLRARELGLAGLGIADRNSVAGVVRAHVQAMQIAEQEAAETRDDEEQSKFRVAVGARLVFSDETPDILAYPRDRAAWGRLTRLLSLGKRRAEKGDCILRVADLLDFNAGLNLIVMPSPPQQAGEGREGAIEATAMLALLARLKEAGCEK